MQPRISQFVHKVTLTSVLTRQCSCTLERVVAMFKTEVFNALQMRFGPSKYMSLKTTLQNATPN
jgi:hypothetical protein